MKVPAKTSETWISGVKLGIIRLGRAAGKVKYTLLDEPDIALAQQFNFEVKTVIDKDGGGAKLFARTYENTKPRTTAQFLHDMLWERCYGGIAPGFKIMHRNGITMDNRMENLCLVPADATQPPPYPVQKKIREPSLYWAAMSELPPDHLIEDFDDHHRPRKFFCEAADEDVTYFECHFGPCSNLEKEPREFSICGRCQKSRYCGSYCQQRDWPTHKAICKEKPSPILQHRYPER